MTPADASPAQATLSGRELALMRRQVMALHGKAGVTRPASATSVVAATARPAMAVSRPVERHHSGAPAAAASAARQRRQALSQSGKAALAGKASPSVPQKWPVARVAAQQTESAGDGGCGCQGGVRTEGADVCTTATAIPTVTTSSYQVSPASTAPSVLADTESDVGSARAVARARRLALATDGKTGLQRVAQVIRSTAATPSGAASFASGHGATGRQKAMHRRQVQSRSGSVKASAETRTTGRMRARSDASVLSGVMEGLGVPTQAQTGTPIDRSKKVTGIEAGRSGKVTGDETGTCRGITGTEYLKADRDDGLNSSPTVPSPAKGLAQALGAARGKSAAGLAEHRADTDAKSDRLRSGGDFSASGNGARAPQKVAVTHTSHGKPVSGTAMGQSGKVTGDDTGACRGITGTEYLAVEQFQAVCGTTAPVSPRKVSVMSSRSSQTVSGSEVGRSSKVTGDEPGSCRAITGSQYYTPESFGALCDAPSPHKVASMQTNTGRALTGTDLNRSTKMTGGEKGGCSSVTGTEYVGAQQQQAVCADSDRVEPVAKVSIDHTWRGQPVSGSYVGRSKRVTGDEPGGCVPISGTPYIGRGQYNNFCEAPAAQAQEARMPSKAMIPTTAVTGDRPGAGGPKLTGDERGACGTVSGTPYIGADNGPKFCATSGRFVSRTSTWVEPQRAPAPVAFSISTPARAAQQRQSGEVSGSGGNSERITGPVNKADGLITGTPEFRHRDSVTSQATPEAGLPAASRLTGDGNQAGRQVTGDAWSALSKVTGTEGASSLSRNPSARGKPRGVGMSAAHFREVVAQPEVPESRITGSSGNTGHGALVTLSGGARG